MPELQNAVVENHPEYWSTNNHYGICGQSCPCCRSEIEEIPGFGTCPICDQLMLGKKLIN